MDEFGELYRKFHEVHQSDERTAKEVDGLVAALDLQKGQRILDLACGWGVHLTELARRGYGPLCGVDAQGGYLEQAAKRLASYNVELVEKDARALDFTAEFDAVYCLYNTLFSWDDATHLSILRSIATSLKPGGCFLFDTTNRERVAKDGISQSWGRPSTNLPWLLRETRFDVHTGDQHLTEHYIFPDRDKAVQTHTFKRRHYTVRELVNLFQNAGLRVTGRFGSLERTPYTLDSPRTVLIAESHESQSTLIER